MTKRLGLLVVISLGVVLVGVGLRPTLAQDGHGEADQTVLRGAVYYAEFCAACHGPEGEAIAAGPAFVAIDEYDPTYAKGRIEAGYDSDPNDDIRMIGYGEDDKGPLSSEQIDDILAYMSTWSDEAVETPELPAPHLEPGAAQVIGPGDSEHGAMLYASYCLGCHERDGRGRDLPNFPAFEVDANIRGLIERGAGHGPVPAFGATVGGPLSTQDIDDLEAYLQSIEAEQDEEGPEGVSILLMILGLGAVAAVGGYYFASQRSRSQAA
ncbi:MAG: c-type cytochrome [Anaerolineales bacterium]|nr:c-type cytochrome [Anaerolineales bacterium]